MDEAHAVEHGALDDVVGRKEAVDVVSAKIGNHFGRRHRAQLDVAIGIETVLGKQVAQQIRVDRVFERNGEFHALPVLHIAIVLVLQRQTDRLAIHVFNRRHDEGRRCRSEAKADRDWHRRQHVRRVEFLVDGLVANDRPAGALDDLDVKPLALIKAHGVRHDDGRRAGDRNKADLQASLFRRAALREYIRRRRYGEHRGNRRRDRADADSLEKGAPLDRIGRDGAKDRAFDEPAIKLVVIRRVIGNGGAGAFVLDL